MNLGTADIIRADSRNLPLADDSVDLIVTSPPYFALRSYQDGGEHYAGQIGDEPTPDEFVSSLLEVTAECMRVLKPSGSLWVNLGDKYARAGGGVRGSSDGATGRGPRPISSLPDGVREKSLIGVPWRYALRCIDDLGLILRAEVIWSKPNGLPESVTDRVRRSHETWFHFTLQPRYFSAVDEIREEQGSNFQPQSSNFAPLGKLPGSVWTVPTQPLRVPDHLGVDHFAAFPMEWPRRIIRGWSPSGVCVECGDGRRPISVRDPIDPRHLASNARGDNRGHVVERRVSETSILRIGLQSGQSPATRITGYTCACTTEFVGNGSVEWDFAGLQGTAPTRPAVVLDPFGGTGTTALVAKAWGRHGISVDMSADYCRLAEWRTNDEAELARAMQVDKPAKQVDGQTNLLDLIDGGDR